MHADAPKNCELPGACQERDLDLCVMNASEGCDLQKTSEYHARADECRALAARTANPDHKSMLLSMAATWESLAVQREAHLARRERLASLESSARAPA